MINVSQNHYANNSILRSDCFTECSQSELHLDR